MNTKACAISLSLLAGACALAMPAVSRAGNVGYYKPADSCAASMGNYAARITAAGHTPVLVTTLDAGSLAPLNGLVIAQGCTAYPGNASVNAAVANGMSLFLEVQHVFAGDGVNLPGSPALAITSYDSSGNCALDADLAAGSPIATGPGGTLTNTSLDSSSYCSPMGWASSASLPAGSIPLLLSGSSANQVAAFSYTFGSGRVVYSQDQYFYFMSGGYDTGSIPGSDAYITNIIAWMVSATTTTCASEGYKNMQLTWCKNICENGLTGKVLDTWIHRWIERYRDLPYCARETPPPPPPAG